MPTYTYGGEPERYYPTLALTPDPGAQYELAANPGDGRWTPPDPDPAAEPAPAALAASRAAKTAPAPTPDPAAPADTPKAGE
ncbi:hypothetical protein [Kitasatospora cineracea]|uniref:hypothetical protein n=1 Tax=Kitasatospora cineracea TaxID=88074 RepID=UPI00379084A8